MILFIGVYRLFALLRTLAHSFRRAHGSPWSPAFFADRLEHVIIKPLAAMSNHRTVVDIWSLRCRFVVPRLTLVTDFAHRQHLFPVDGVFLAYRLHLQCEFIAP